jgi:hypothetical protein
MKYLILFILLTLIRHVTLSQDNFNYPVDVDYHKATETYYVSNWADGAGFILKLNSQGQIMDTYIEGLHYPGGLCIVGDTLFYTDNLSIWDNNLTPSYLMGINVVTGAQFLNYEISTSGTYLDLIDADNDGNLYIGNTREGGNNGIVHKFNIATQQLTNIATNITKPFGVCYDPVDNQVLFVQSSGTLSLVKSVSPEGGTVTNKFYINGYLEGIEMDTLGNFYFSSWGTIPPADTAWGNEPIYKAGHAMNWSMVLESNHNRPFGMCIGKNNHLAVCDWGENSLSFINLNDFGIDEFAGYFNNLKIYPNPSNGFVTLETELESPGNPELMVHDLTGRVVYKSEIATSGIKINHRIDLRFLDPGTYILILASENHYSREKLIIH